MRASDPDAKPQTIHNDSGDRAAAPASRFGEAVDAVYGYASGQYNWEDLIEFLAHLDHDIEKGVAPPSVLAATLGAHLRRADELATRHHADMDAPAPGYALLLLDAERRVIASNEEGRAFFSSIFARVEAGKRLSFHEEEHAVLFSDALAALEKNEPPAPVLLRFLDDDGETKLPCYLAQGEALSAAMLRAAEFDGEEHPHCALIAAPPDAGTQVLNVFRQTLGLTLAEARLAARLRFGLSLKEAAAELGISVNTARNQLKSIFEKLGVNRQADLVRHLTELAALAARIRTGHHNVSATVTAAERRTIVLPDGRLIAFRDLGTPDGVPVFILHPLVQSSLMRPQEAAMAGECGVRLISVERPGIGLSTYDPEGTYASFANDLASVADALGIGNFHLIGWASGAPYALTAASRLGARVSRLALATPRLNFRSDLEATSPMRQFFGGLRRHPWIFETVFSIMRAKRSRRMLRPMIRNFVETSEPDRRLFERDPALLDCFTDSLIEAIDRSHTGIVAELNFYAAETPAETSGLARPLLVWHGLEDEMNSIADVKRMLDGAPVEAFHVVEGQGHMVLFTNFKEVLSRLVHEPH